MKRIEVALLVTSLATAFLAVAIVVLFLTKTVSLPNINVSPDWALSIVNGVATTVLVIVTALQINEAKKARMEERKARIEAAKPILSLEPANYRYESNFDLVTLANSGMVAKNVDIDVKYKENIDRLYISSIGTAQRVPILKGAFPDNGGVVTVQVKYIDTFGNSYTDNLSIDFDSINREQRRFTYITSQPDYIAMSIQTVRNELSSIDNRLEGSTRAIWQCVEKLQHIEETLKERKGK